MSIAFITGGSGFVGREFIQYVFNLSPALYSKLRVLSRSEAADKAINNAAGKNVSKVEIVRGDLSDIELLRKNLVGTEVCYHIGAKVTIWGPWEEFVEANVTGTSNLLSACKQAGVKRFVHVSTEATLLNGLHTGCYDNADETVPLSLDPPFYAPYTRSKAMAEKLVLEANDPPNFITVAVKPRFVWGKGDTQLVPQFVQAIKDGRMKWFTPEPMSSTCHIGNLCEGMILAAQKGKPGNAYFLTDGDVVNLNAFIRRLVGNQADCDSVGSMNSTVLWWIATLIENIPLMGYGTTREPPINRQVLGLMAQNVIVNDKKAREELGYTSHVTREAGLAEWLEANK